MTADEITKAIENRIAEIDARAVELARERTRLVRMLPREEAPTRIERFGEIELPPMPDVPHLPPVIQPIAYPPPHVPGVFGARPELPADPIVIVADRNAS